MEQIGVTPINWELINSQQNYHVLSGHSKDRTDFVSTDTGGGVTDQFRPPYGKRDEEVRGH